MTLAADLKAWVTSTFESSWDTEETGGVPSPENLRLNANHAKDLTAAVVLYADLDGSTDMVDNYQWWFSAEVYKTFLKCASDIIRSEGGTITSYDGDRVMAVFTGASKNTTAVRAALKINYAVTHIIQPALIKRYPKTKFELKHVVGIDNTQLRAARIGVKGDNDLVWIGRAANYAAKLTSLADKTTFITEAVHSQLREELRESNGLPMWVKEWWPDKGIWIYSSTWWWRLD